MATNIVRLKGDKVDLCVMRTDEEAIESYLKWMNDESFNMWIGKNNVVTDRVSEEEWIKSKHNDSFNIVLKNGVLIGNCRCSRIGNSRNYELGICIGKKEGRGQGYGTEVIKMLIRFAFWECNAHRVRLTLSSDNSIAFHCYEKAGLKYCGKEHETHFYRGTWYDTLYMELLENEFFDREEDYCLIGVSSGSNKCDN